MRGYVTALVSERSETPAHATDASPTSSACTHQHAHISMHGPVVRDRLPHKLDGEAARGVGWRACIAAQGEPNVLAARVRDLEHRACALPLPGMCPSACVSEIL